MVTASIKIILMPSLIKQSLTFTTTNLLANKARSFLTMLGIIIGVAAVIMIMSVGAGAQSLILSQIESLGSNLVGVLPGGSDEDEPPASIMGIVITTLKYEDVLALKKKKNVPNLQDVVAFYNGVGDVQWQSNSYNTNLSGCTSDYIAVEGGSLKSGRFFTQAEERNLSKVVVLGSAVKDELFGNSDAVGERVKIKKHIFEVIGVMEERGTVAFQNYDDKVFIPLRTMQKLISGVEHVSLIRARVDSENNIPRAIEDIKQILREQHGISDSSGQNDDFTVRSADQALDIITTITDALKYFLAAMASLSLVVGGIGIMNIMLVSVKERTREIGLRKAVGASSTGILSQFLTETIFITIIGGIIGIIFGVTISYFIAVGVQLAGYDWKFAVSPVSILLGIGVAGLVGLIFGLYPAHQASQMEPVEALRYE